MTTEKEPIIYWNPGSGSPHDEDYRDLMQEWFGHDVSASQIAIERRYMQEQVEARAEANGQPFILVKATPRWLRYQLARHELEFTLPNVQVFVATFASQPGFDSERVYDTED